MGARPALGHVGKMDGNNPNGTAFLQYHMFPNSRLINSNFRTKNSHYLYPQNKNKKRLSKGTIYIFHKKSPHSNSYLTLRDLFLFLKLQYQYILNSFQYKKFALN